MKSSKNMFDAFPPADTAAWEKTAREELQGEDPWVKLGREYHGVTLKPYYSPDDAPPSPFRLSPALGTFHGPRTWYNSPRVVVGKESQANAEALEHLENGADGIAFELAGPVRFPDLLKNIQWPVCALHFFATGATEKEAAALADYMGGFSGDALGAWYGPGASLLPSDRGFSAVGIQAETATAPAESIARALSLLYHDLAKVPHRHAALCVDTGSDFFFEIAKLRAARQAWQALYTSRKQAAPALYIHTWSKAGNTSAYDPHGQMIRATTAAMASILGGCNALTVDGDPHDQEMPRRVARNVATILREESRFAKVADPVGGSYFVDHLTAQLSAQIGEHLTPLLR